MNNSKKFSKKNSCQAERSLAGFLHLGTPVYQMLCHPLKAVFPLFMLFSGAPQVPVIACPPPPLEASCPWCCPCSRALFLTACVCHQHTKLQLCTQSRQALDHALHGTHEAHPHGVHQHASAETPADTHVCGRLHGDGKPRPSAPLPHPQQASALTRKPKSEDQALCGLVQGGLEQSRGRPLPPKIFP